MDISKCWFAYLFFLLLCFCFHFSQAAMDTISPGQLVNNSETIISAGQKFELGFFRPGKSTNYYLGIWYKFSTPTVVWVANRDSSFNSLAVLSISTDGNLVILQGKISYAVSNASSNGNTSATLLDSGNLVLRDEKSNILWQSFDFPTHTLLPGMKIGYDKKNEKSWSLVSWNSSDDPSPGVFSMQLDPNGSNSIIVMRGSEQYWTSGPWDGKFFMLIPEMRFNRIYNFTFVPETSDREESYFEINVYDKSIIFRNVMDVSGQVQQLTWLDGPNQWNLLWAQPKSQCEVYDFCGAFGSCSEQDLPFCKCLPGFEPRFPENWYASDFSAGCARKTSMQYCENISHAMGDGDDFSMLSKVSQLPNNAGRLEAGNAGECKLLCLNNCSCTAYTYIDGRGCSIWVGDLFNLKLLSNDDSAGEDLYYRLAASELSKSPAIKSKSKRHTLIFVIVAISLTVKCG